jgi:reticulon-4-interacting protein 1, mitochondrial
MADLPSTMRAWAYRQSGLPSQVVKLETTFRTPKATDLGPNELLVEIHYTSFNGGVTLVAQSLRPRPLAFFISKEERVGIMELEFAGRMVAAGKNVLSSRPDLRLGEFVVGCMDEMRLMRRGAGSLAEYVVVKADMVAPYELPGGEKSKFSLAEWAGLSAVGCTAVQVTDRMGIKAGDKVLINGSSGGAGVLMVQVVKSIVGPGGRVVATCSGRNVDLVKSLGADEVIDYRQCGPLHAHLAASEHAKAPFDAIIDCVGIQALFAHSPAYLAPKGKFVNLGAMDTELSVRGLFQWVGLSMWNRFCPRIFGGVPRDYEFYSARVNVPSLERLRKMVQDGKLRQVIDSIWEFEDVPKVGWFVLFFPIMSNILTVAGI